jgi:alcohol dehydrogenase, propanol-preferring
MKAILLEDQDRIENHPLKLREVQKPQPGPGEILVKVAVCAVCRTDLHVVEGDLLPKKLPLIPGHQAVGRVEGSGKRVGVAWLRSTDGTCKHCKGERENLCVNSQYTGYHADGGFAEHLTVPEAHAYPIPEGLSDQDAAPLLCAGLIGYRALKRANVPEGGKLLLVGFGSSAHIVLQFALFLGYEVYVATRSRCHRELALKMGAFWAGEDLEEVPVKADSAILFAPSGALVPPTLAAIDRGGTLALAGIHMSEIPSLDYERHLFHDKEVRSVAANTRRDGFDLLEAAVAAKIKPLVVSYPLAEANRALSDLKTSSIDGTGVLIVEG